jgi:opacity protein-like surface antigen
MKTLVIAAVAALGLTSAVYADSFDTNLLKTTLVTENLEFSVAGTVGSDLDTLGDVWQFEAGGYILPHTVGTFDGEVYLFGQFGEAAGATYGALGAEYILGTDFNGGEFEMSATANYVMYDDFDNGDLLLTPRARVTLDATDSVSGFGELGYSWVATDDFSDVGGYGELGFNFGLTNEVMLSTSVVAPFETANDDMLAKIELTLDF